MGILSKLLTPAPKQQRARRGSAFPGADSSRLTSSWTYDPTTINRQLRYELRLMRSRARSLARADSYAGKFIDSCVSNIAGPNPFALQSKIMFATSGTPNKTANNAIEAAYRKWSKPGGCEITGKLSLGELDRLTIRGIARDGEALLRKVVTPAGLRYQVLDIERLDEGFNDNLKDGAIKMSVEVDMTGRPRAYWLLKENPGESGEWNRGRERERERVPAEQIDHLFIPDWPEQVRGLPWLHAAMIRLWHLGEFEHAAVINARVGATKLAILQSPNGEPPDSLATGQASVGNLLEDAEPGQYWTLPEGYELKDFTPTFPDAAIEPFIRTCLRGVAAGLGVAYHSLANDPAQVNYSTARVALLEERDMWQTVQQWYVDHVCYPRLQQWLRIEGLANRMPYSYADASDDARFQCKTWGWVDPEKEIQGKILALDSQLTSRTRIAMEYGSDFEEILDELAQEQKLADEAGVILQSQKPGLATTEPIDGPAEDTTPAADASSADTAPKKLNGKAHSAAASH